MAPPPVPNDTPQGGSPPISLARSLHADAPFASFAALSDLPEHPEELPATRDTWARITTALRHQTITAELSFHTMRLWYGNPEFALSRIGGFVVIRLRDHVPNHTLVLAMPGARTSRPVVAQLAALLRTRTVRLLPEPTARALAPAAMLAGVALRNDRDSADYVLSMDALSSLEGRELHGRRKEVRRLERRYGERLDFRAGALDEPWAHEHLAATMRTWIDQKFRSPAELPAAIRREWNGIIAWRDDPHAGELRLFAVSLDGRPVAASVVAPMWNGQWMGVVMKTDPTVPGLCAYLRKRVATVALRELGPGAEFNIQQDDGLPGLRHAKGSYDPIRLVPKFTVDHGSAQERRAA